MAYLYFLFIKRGVNLKNLGEYLKRSRIEMGVSIDEAADDIELTVMQLENIESGNVKAFKDVYNLKKYVINYAKYLGLNEDEVIDEFNGFLFEHTSKLSLSDIMEAQRKKDSAEGKRIKSPYTKVYVKKVNIYPWLIGCGIFVIFLLIMYLIMYNMNRVPDRVDELSGVMEDSYEFTK